MTTPAHQRQRERLAAPKTLLRPLLLVRVSRKPGAIQNCDTRQSQTESE